MSGIGSVVAARRLRRSHRCRKAGAVMNATTVFVDNPYVFRLSFLSSRIIPPASLFHLFEETRVLHKLKRMITYIKHRKLNTTVKGKSFPFLVACYAISPSALSVHPSNHPPVRLSVTLFFFAVFALTTPAQMIK